MADNDGVLDIVFPKLGPEEDETMPTDMDDDMTQILLEEGGRASNLLLAETSANIQHVSNVARSSAVKKFDEVDPIESAAVEQIFRR